MHRFLRAYVLFTGSVIGVGFFGIPYVMIHAGLLPTLLVGIVVLGLVWITHVLFLEIILRTKGLRRLPGYVGAALGPIGKSLATLGNVSGLVSALLAYLVIGGTFLSFIVAPLTTISPFTASMVYLVCAALLLLRRQRTLFVVQVGILLLFLLTLAILWIGAFSQMQWSNIPLFGGSFLLPYGVLLFSFWSLSLLPELVELLQGKREDVRKVLRGGFLTAAITYLLFALLIAGVTGGTTSEDAFTALASFVGHPLVMLGALFGILTTLDSFLALSLTLAKTLHYDFRIRATVAWAASFLAPCLLLILGLHQFVSLLSITGAVFLGLEGFLILLVVWRSRWRTSARLGIVGSSFVLECSMLILFGGVIFEVLRVLKEI